MTRGHSLEQDLRFLINNPKYSDIEILCKDDKKLHGCRAILAARSEVFDRLLYNAPQETLQVPEEQTTNYQQGQQIIQVHSYGQEVNNLSQETHGQEAHNHGREAYDHGQMKESYENQISFPEIHSFGMKIILEYIYTGLIKEESLTKDNIVEVFYAADYFQLPGLQDFVMKTVKNTNDSPELLSKVADKMPLSENDILLNLLVEQVAVMPLNTIEFDRLSVAALRYLLSYTHGKEKPFVTPEYEVFRYSAILAAKQVSNDAYKALTEQLPTLEQLESSNSNVKNKSITDHQKVAKELEPLIKFIDFKRIKGQILADIIDPLEIIPTEIISNVYRQKVRSNDKDSNEFRGIAFLSKSDLVWDESACGSELIIKDNGKIVRASNSCISFQSVRAKIALDKRGIFEWDVIIEKACNYSWVGVCASENFSY